MSILGCGAEMAKLMSISDDDVQTIEDVLKERMDMGIARPQAQRQAVAEAIAIAQGEREIIMGAIRSKVSELTPAPAPIEAQPQPKPLEGPEDKKAKEPKAPKAPKEPKEPPAKKLENTGADLRRFWEKLKDDLTAAKSSGEKAWAQIDAATQRSKVFAPKPGEGATPGVQRYFDEIRSKLGTFRENLDESELLGYRYSGESVSEIAARRIDQYTDKDYLGKLTSAASGYTQQMGALAEHLSGATTVEQAAEKLGELIGAKSDNYWAPMVIKDAGQKMGLKLLDEEEGGILSRKDNDLIRYLPEASSTKRLAEGQAKADEANKSRMVRPRIDKVSRDMAASVRDGDVTPEQFKAEFGFADIGFGTYVASGRDQKHMNAAWDALADMADRLKLPRKAIGFFGQMHFTIGALGHGVYGAHFSPNQPHPNGGTVPVVNLTNTRGDGAVAHEWGHALDWLAMRGDAQAVAVMREVQHAMRYTTDLSLAEASILDGLQGHSYMTGRNGPRGSIENIQALVQYYAGRARPNTDYYKNAQALGKDYWGTPHEMFARAWEAFIFDTLGGTNDYLVNQWVSDGHVTKEAGWRGTPYPQDEERKRINQVFQAMVSSMKVVGEAVTFDREAFRKALPESVSKYSQRVQELVDSVPERKRAYDQKKADEAAARKNQQEQVEAAKLREAQEAIEADLRLKEQERQRLMASLETAKDAGNVTETTSPNVPLSDADLNALFDQALSEVQERSAERPAIKSPDRTRREPTSTQSPAPTTTQRPDPTAAQPRDATASDLIAEAARQGVKGLDETFTALTKLFGGGPGKLGSGLSFDEETYAKAKPHFQEALEAYQAAGRSLLDLFKLLIQKFGADVRPYLIRFAKDGNLSLNLGNAQPENQHAVHADPSNATDDRATDQGSAPDGLRADEGGRDAGASDRRPDNVLGDDLRGVARDGRPDATAENSGSAQEGTGDGDAQSPVLGGSDAAGAGLHARGRDYRLTEQDFKREGSWKDTAERNLDIIALSKKIEAEGRAATPEEQALLARYTGWGASELAQNIFPMTPEYARKEHPVIYPPHAKPEFRALAERAEKELSLDELREAAASTQFAHFTQAGIVRGMWGALARFGFKGGKMFEAGLGNGLFPMMAPESLSGKVRYLGIEKDILTARIAKLLLPEQAVRNEDFTRSKIPFGYFDAILGNPPFANIVISNDPAYKKQRFLLHDYFLAKQIDALRPGGIMGVVVSKGTMDKLDDKARQYLSDRADLLGAIRLPNNAFSQNAGTEVVTDVLFFKKRAPGEAPAGAAWTNTASVEITTKVKRGEYMEVKLADGQFKNQYVGAGETVTTRATINEYFVAHPEMVLGRHSLAGSMYRANEYTVEATDGDLIQKFNAAIESLPAGAYTEHIQPPEQQKRRDVLERDLSPAIRKEGALYLDDKGNARVVEKGVGVDANEVNRRFSTKDLSVKDLAWLKSYAGLKAAQKEARYAQFQDADNWQLMLKRLQKAYAVHVKQHGRLNAFRTQQRVSKTELDDEGKQVVTEFRVFLNNRLARLDIESTLVLSLEEIKEDGQIVEAAGLRERTVKKPSKPVINSTSDALGVSLNERGALDLAHVAELAGKDREAVIRELGDGIFESAPGQWLMADEYLSGDVVTKLDEATAMASAEPARFNRNVQALLRVQPRPLAPSDISVSLGAGWISPSHVQDFANDVLGIADTVNYSEGAALWTVQDSGGRTRTARRGGANDWNVAGKLSAGEILSSVLNSKTIKIVVPATKDTPSYTDQEGTEAANSIAKKMADRFKNWVWADKDRARELLDIYNSRFNRLAPRRFSGEFLTLPGITSKVNPYPHQKAVVWRAIQTGNLYAAHAVGAGKTMEMIMSGMEMKRLGLVNKPLYVVPNHMLEQFSNEFQQLYPTADIMVADDEKFHTSNRRRFMAQAAVNAPDAIIVTHSSFGKLALSAKSQNEVIQSFLDDIQEALDDETDKRSPTRKKLEAQKERMEKRLLSISNEDVKDQNLTFEEMGVDYVFLDEAHEFRKLDFTTNRGNVKGIDPAGSSKALDLYMKVLYLEKQKPGRSHFFASGTPITNTIGELYSLMRFFMGDQMKEEGIAKFDAWSKQFADVKAEGERNAAGNYEIVERFSKIVNVPELMKRFRTFADVITSSQLGELVKRPSLKDGKPRMVEAQASPALRDYMENVLAPRIEASKKWKPSPSEKSNPDPIINIITDGSLSTLDERYFNPSSPGTGASKLDMMIDNIIADAKRFKDIEFKNADGTVDPVKGAVQIVFSPIGLGEGVAKRGFDAYEHINKRLVAGGFKRGEIAWMRDLKTDAAKEKVFSDMRAGRVKVLIGSPKNMGTGVNVQRRLKKLHFLAPPWFPSDVEQPQGRILRQGNQNQEVEIDWYVTVGTYDASKWSMVARKDKFIQQALSGDDSIREMEDISEESLYAQAAAVASGDQRQIELVQLEGDIQRYQRLKGAHAERLSRLRSDRGEAQWQIDYLKKAIKVAEDVSDKVSEDPKETTVTIDGDALSLEDAVPKIISVVKMAALHSAESLRTIGRLGELGELRVTTSKWNEDIEVSLVYQGSSDDLMVKDELLRLEKKKVDAGVNETGMLQRLVNVQRRVASKVTDLHARMEQQQAALRDIEAALEKPFAEGDKLAETQARYAALQQELLAETAAKQAGSAPAGQNNGITYSVGSDATLHSSPARAQAVQAVESTVSAMRAGWANSPEIVVAFDMRDPRIPADVRKADEKARSQGKGGAPEGFYYQGKVYLFASKLRTPNDVARVLAHEALGHFGLRGLFGEALKPILQQVATMRRKEVDAKIREYTKRGVKNISRLDAAEEVLAEMSQTMPEIGFVKRAIAAIRAFFRKIGIPMSMTDNDIIANFILPARRFVEGGSGGGSGGGGGGLAFSRAGRADVMSTPAFKAWFGGSKVVDADGKPLVVYHGSPNATFTEFDVSNVGVFFSDRFDIAASYAGRYNEVEFDEEGAYTDDDQGVYQTYLSIKNPKVVDWKGKDWGDGPNGLKLDDIAAMAKREGFDGLIVENVVDTGWRAPGLVDDNGLSSVYVAFRPEQIKSATGNNGEFDPANPDIRYSPASTSRDLTQKASEAVRVFANTPGKVNWWHKTVGTQYNLAQRSPAYKRVYDAVQDFIGDVSYYATEAADLAPKILPKLDTWRDIAKSPLSAEDTKAIAAPIFEGTLTWSRDESGRPVKVAQLEEEAALMSSDRKSQRLLRNNKISEGVLKMWRGLPLEQYEALIDSKYEKEMLKAGVVWSDAELRAQFHLTDDQIGLYREFRKATDKSLTNLAISDMLYFGGKDVEPIKEAVLDAKTVGEAAEILRDYLMSLANVDPANSETLIATANKMLDKGDRAADLMARGYAPLSRFGTYTLDVVDASGDRVYFGLFESRFEAARMAKQMAVEYPGGDISQGTLSEESYKLFAGVSPETVALFGDMLGLEDNGAYQEYLKLAKSTRSAMKRLIERKGIAGFSEDAGRVLAGFVYSNARQTSQNLHTGEMTQAANDIPKGQGELKDKAAQLVEYIKHPQEEAQQIRGLLFAQYIGGSVASAMVNTTQPFTMTLPWLSQFGGLSNAGKQMAAALKDAGKKTTGNAALDAALKRGEEDGTVSPQEVHDLMRQAQGKGALKSGDGTKIGNAAAMAQNGVSRIAFAWGKLFSTAEQFNRRVTFIAAYRTAVEQGMADPDAFARRAIHETQGVYNKGNKPDWARGALGSTLFTFKQYSIAYVEMLHRMATTGAPGSAERAAGRRGALYALAVLMLLSGVGGLPGADDLDDIISGLMQALGYNFDSKAKRKAFLAEYLGDGAAQFMERGVSGIAGVPIDISGRMGLGNLIPATGLLTKKADHTSDVAELLGPAGDMAKRAFQAGGKVIEGDILGSHGAIATAAPKAVQNLIQAADMAQTGMYRDQTGKKVVETGPGDALAKALGFQPNDVKRQQDATWEIQRMVGLNRITESEIADRWAIGLFEKDPEKVQAARDDLAKWNEDNPESPIRIKFPQILQRVRSMNQTKTERIAKTAPKELKAQVRQALERQ